jgi:hypothetical protein
MGMALIPDGTFTDTKTASGQTSPATDLTALIFTGFKEPTANFTAGGC